VEVGVLHEYRERYDDETSEEVYSRQGDDTLGGDEGVLLLGEHEQDQGVAGGTYDAE